MTKTVCAHCRQDVIIDELKITNSKLFDSEANYHEESEVFFQALLGITKSKDLDKSISIAREALSKRGF